MTQLLAEHPAGRDVERAYAIDVVLGEFLGIDHVTAAAEREDVRITIADGTPGEVLVADAFFTADEGCWLTAASLPRRPLARLDVERSGLAPLLTDPSLPVIYGAPVTASGEWVVRADGQASLGVDVFGSAFFMLTRYEELVVRDRDHHARFPAAASTAVREGYLQRPIVDEYAELLWSTLRAVWPRLERRRREFRLLLSHDVDWPRSPRRSLPALTRTLSGDLLARRDPRLAIDRSRAELRARRRDGGGDLYDTFDFLMDSSEAAGVRSAFYFQAVETRAGIDPTYSLDEPWLGALMKRMHQRGHELGLHPSYDTFRSAEAITQELATLLEACARLGIEQSGWGGRQHFLRWQNPDTWQAWEDAGLRYDSTLTFAEQVGFRTGACREYPAFNLLAGRRLKLRERPLVVMEGSLLDYSGASRDEFRETVTRLREQCRLMRGDFTLLWHNSSLLSRRDRRLYAEVIAG